MPRWRGRQPFHRWQNTISYIKLFRVTEFVTMYDTCNMRLAAYDAPGIDFLKDIPGRIEGAAEHTYQDAGAFIITGTIPGAGGSGLKVSISQAAVSVKDGSFSKWLLGDNVQTMSRGDMETAVEAISDCLGLPMWKASVTRVDVAGSFIMRYPPAAYFPHLGLLRYAIRLQEPDGLYYKTGAGRLVFYDKGKELKTGGEVVPEICRGKNLLRYERRFTTRLPHYLNRPDITAADLYNGDVYSSIISKWEQSYKDIEKINDYTLNVQAMKSKKDFDRASRLALIEKLGGELAALQMVKEQQLQGNLTKKQAYDIRGTIKDACHSGMSITTPNEVISELNDKIMAAALMNK